MNSSTKDGGPAFPVSGAFDGMSLRDWLAGQAMIGLVQFANMAPSDEAETVAFYAYKAADAMLNARAGIHTKRVGTTPKKWTPKNWTLGVVPNTIVADYLPHDALSGSDEVGHYGGYLIAESVAPSNHQLIAAAPNMLEALKNLENDNMSIPYHAWELVQLAIAKAEGRGDA